MLNLPTAAELKAEIEKQEEYLKRLRAAHKLAAAREKTEEEAKPDAE